MQCTLQELTNKLLKALDEDNNVVDMRTVLEVVSILEDFAVTKETLGETRVGKYVNEMRRKTSDKDLSRRAKNLVRRWKQMVDAAAGSVNGEGIAARPTGGLPQSLPPHMVQSAGSKPSSPASRPATPSSGKSTQSPSLPSRSSRPDTPSAISQPATPSSVQSPGLSLTRPGTPGSTDSPLARDASTRFQQRSGPTATSTPVQTPGGTPETLSKTNASNKKRRREIDSGNVPNKKTLFTTDGADSESKNANTKTPKNGIVPGLHGLGVTRPNSPITHCDKALNSPVGVSFPKQKSSNTTLPEPEQLLSRGAGDQGASKDRVTASRKPRVQTTAELLAGLKAKGNLGSTEVSKKIARHQIVKEEDDVNASIVPAGAKPRPRRKPGTVVPPSTSEKSLKETKKDMVQKFLDNSYDPLDGDPYERTTPSPLKLDSNSRTASPALIETECSNSVHNNGSANTSAESNDMHADVETHFFTDDNRMRRVDELTAPVIEDNLDELWSSLPPLLPEDEIDWTEEEYVPRDHTVTEEDVDRLHDGNWDGVNGQFDHNNEWVDWSRTYSIPSYNEDLLPILPYVDIGD